MKLLGIHKTIEMQENDFSFYATLSGGVFTIQTKTPLDFLAATPITYNSAGQYTINFKAGYFLNPPVVQFSSDNSTTNHIVSTVTTTSALIYTRQDGGAYGDFAGNFRISVHRQEADYKPLVGTVKNLI